MPQPPFVDKAHRSGVGVFSCDQVDVDNGGVPKKVDAVRHVLVGLFGHVLDQGIALGHTDENHGSWIGTLTIFSGLGVAR